jgi:hypothetical protein
MSDQSDSFVLTFLRAIRADLAEVKLDVAELVGRLGLLEALYPSLSRRVNRLSADMDRIKRRLDIADAPAT